MDLSQKVCRRFTHTYYFINEAPGFKGSADKLAGVVSMHHKLSTSMPTTAPLRRAVPPRSKNEMLDFAHDSPTQPQEEEITAPQAKVLLPESTSDLFINTEGEKTEAPSCVNSKPVPTTKPPLPAGHKSPVLAQNSSLVTEGPTLVSWKSIHPSPSPSPSNEDTERAPVAKGTMPATDAQEIIDQGISLKERMAVFQGRGGPEPANPPPLPTTKKPKWKPPPNPKPLRSPSMGEEKLPVELKTVIRSPLVDTESTQVPTKKPVEPAEQRDKKVKELEEEECQSHAEIATHMQRLNGARVGKAPPVIAPKPPIRRPGVPKEEEARPGTYCIQ